MSTDQINGRHYDHSNLNFDQCVKHDAVYTPYIATTKFHQPYNMDLLYVIAKSNFFRQLNGHRRTN